MTAARRKQPAAAAPPPPRAPRPVLLAFLLAALALAFTADERVFGLITDGQMITRTAFSMTELHELGIARGHRVGIPRPAGDAVTRYGIGPSLVQTVPMLFAESLERNVGPSASQTLFVLEQIVWLLLAALAAAWLVKAWGGEKASQGKALLACALASPLAAYAGSDFSEPLQAALVGLAFVFGGLAVAPGASPRRAALLSLAAGAVAGFALLSKSTFAVLLPALAAMLFFAGDRSARLRRAASALAGWAVFAGLWLAFEIVRFGRPFASYQGEHFSNPPLDGLWRLTLGPNKGLLFYFPLVLLAIPGAVALFRRNRAVAAPAVGFVLFVLVTTAAWWAWDGTAGWGPRLLLPTIPILAALAALAAPALPAFAFWTLFGAGVLVNAIGVFQPDALTTWYYTILPKRVMTDSEAARYPEFAYERGPDGKARLYPIHDVARHAAFSPIRVGAWLLHTRLVARDVLVALKTPPWRTDVPGQEVAVPPEQAIPQSALVFLTAKARWPHLGMSLTRGKEQLDSSLAYVDSLYDQALRAQDMGAGARAASFGERLYALVPGPQTAAALLEGYRVAGRKEAIQEVLKTVPRAHAASAEFGMALALFSRDIGDEESARKIVSAVAAASQDPRYQRLAALPMSAWPAKLRDITAPRARAAPAAPAAGK